MRVQGRTCSHPPTAPYTHHKHVGTCACRAAHVNTLPLHHTHTTCMCARARAGPHMFTPCHCTISTRHACVHVRVQGRTCLHPATAPYTHHMHVCTCACKAAHVYTLPLHHTLTTCMCARAHAGPHMFTPSHCTIHVPQACARAGPHRLTPSHCTISTRHACVHVRVQGHATRAQMKGPLNWRLASWPYIMHMLAHLCA